MATQLQPAVDSEVESLRTQLAALDSACAGEQTARREAQQQLRTLLEYAPEAIVLLDVTTGRFIDANLQAEQMFGLSRDKLMELGPFDLSPPSQPGGSSAELGGAKIEEAVNGGAPVFEWWHCDAQGRRFPCEVRLVRMPWGSRDVIRGSITEVSARKKLELCARGRSEVLEKVARQFPIQDVLQHLVHTIEDILPGLICSVLRLDPATNRLHLAAAPSLPDFYNAAVEGLAIGPDVGSCGTAAYTGRRVVVSDVMTHPYWSKFRELAAQAKLGACWSEPILSLSGEVLGTFAMYYRESREPVQVELDVIEIAAQLAAVAIEHERTQSLLQELNSSLERRVVEKTLELTRANSELRTAQEDLRLAAVAFESHNSVLITDCAGRILRVNESFTRMTGYTPEEAIGKTPRILRSGQHDREFYRQMWNTIRTLGHWEGEIWNRRKNGEIYPQQLTVTSVKDPAGNVTHYVGEGQDITEKLRADADRASIDVARQIQEDLFPKGAPMVPGFEVAGAVSPAQRVSGDYYDFLPLRDSSLGLVVADVSGHGLGPAMLMAQTQAYLRVLAKSHVDPGEILAQANRLLTLSDSGHFVTLFFGRLDPETRSFTYAGAGHQAYLVRRDGSVQILRATSLPLGFEELQSVPLGSPLVLEPGEIVLVPTDGIQDATNLDGEQMGRDRAFDVVRHNRTKAARDIVQAILDATLDFARGSPRRDDITAIVLKSL